jgi:hypothetical protein
MRPALIGIINRGNKGANEFAANSIDVGIFFSDDNYDQQ